MGDVFVFGYGSLVPPTADDVASSAAVVAHLSGARRRWTVAMDNIVDLPRYKYYRDADGGRPDVAVAFLDLDLDLDLDLTPDADVYAAQVPGVCVPVDAARLAALDRRERQYRRVDVTDRLAGAPGPTWTYVGRDDARQRARTARAAGRLVVARSYLAAVAAGAGRLPGYDASTDAPDVPVLDLRRIDT